MGIKIVKKRAYGRTFSGLSGFTRYAYKRTKKDAESYKERLKNQPSGNKRLVRILPLSKNTPRYNDGFRYEIFSRHKP